MMAMPRAATGELAHAMVLAGRPTLTALDRGAVRESSLHGGDA
ncbi:hypothetical protein [Dactylosporangium sp. NPDC051541]